MKKLSADVSNTLLDVRLLKKKVVLVFKDQNIDIASSTYLEFKPYVGKKYSKSELESLLNFNSYQKDLNYAINLISKYAYTSFLIKQKLAKRGINEENIIKILNYLNQNNLLDDKDFAEHFVYEAIINYQGSFKIKKRLKEKGIKDDIIDIYLSKYQSLIKDTALKYLISLDEIKYHNAINKKEKIIRHLLNRGYEHDLIFKLLNEHHLKKSEGDFNIRKDYEKFKRLYQNHDKIILALKRKGYHYLDIKKMMEENNNEIY